MKEEGDARMKIAVFYENIHEGALAAGQRTEDALAALRDAGMELLYLTPDSWKRDRRELSRTMEKLGLGIEGMHAFCDFAEDPETGKYTELIDLAAEAGAGNLLLIPGMYSTGDTHRDLDSMVSGMRKAVAYGRGKGLPVLMEDFDGPLAPYNCIAGLQYFFDRVEGLGCAFDTGNFVTFREDELAAFDLFADRIRTVHLKDRSLNRRHAGDTPYRCADGREVFACPLGTGYIRMAEILGRLKERGYSGNVIVELYACDPSYVLRDAADSVRWVWEQLNG